MEKLFLQIDQLHNEDPVKEYHQGESIARELLYSQRMIAMLKKIYPENPPYMELAARSQHLCRWQVKRGDFPDGRVGYYAWRNAVHHHQVKIASHILKEANIDDEIITKIIHSLDKKNIKTDLNAQMIEDVSCLVFIEHYLEDFIKKHSEEKVIDIIKKTTGKMSKTALDFITQLELSDPIKNLLKKVK